MVAHTTVRDKLTKCNARSKDCARWSLLLKNRKTYCFTACGHDLIGYFNVIDFDIEQKERF